MSYRVRESLPVLAVEASMERFAATPEARALFTNYVASFVAMCSDGVASDIGSRVRLELASIVDRVCTLPDVDEIEIHLARDRATLTICVLARSEVMRFDHSVAVPILGAPEM